MFGEQFFPTPLETAKKMLEPYDRKFLREAIILDPQAGSGDLLDAVVTKIVNDFRYEGWDIRDHDLVRIKRNIYAIELDPDLQHILRGKGYKVIGSDFLTYDGDYVFDLIVSNPPFRTGIQHTMKALQMIREHGGEFTVLLNEANFNRERSETATELERWATESVSLGKAFLDPETKRKADVDVRMLRFKQEKQGRLGLFDDPTLGRLEKFKDQSLSDVPFTELATLNVFDTMERSFKLLSAFYIEYRKHARTLARMEELFDWDYQDRQDMERDLQYADSDTKAYNLYLEYLTKAGWNTLFRITNVEKRLTERVRKEFNDNRKGMGLLEYTKDNMLEVLDILIQGYSGIMEQCILDVYDELTRYHENAELEKKWKTNNAFRVKKKVILPYAVSHWLGRFEIEYRTRNGIISDIDKAMCFLTGQNHENIVKINDAVEEKSKEIGNVPKGRPNTRCESEFFVIEFFKAGSLHLTFKNEKQWNFLNEFVARKRGWLQENEPKGRKGTAVQVVF
jgi:hypothetical protein